MIPRSLIDNAVSSFVNKVKISNVRSYDLAKITYKKNPAELLPNHVFKELRKALKSELMKYCGSKIQFKYPSYGDEVYKRAPNDPVRIAYEHVKAETKHLVIAVKNRKMSKKQMAIEIENAIN